MNITRAVCAVGLAVLLPSLARAGTIHPAVNELKDWILWRVNPDDPSNGMRRTVKFTYTYSATVSITVQKPTPTPKPTPTATPTPVPPPAALLLTSGTDLGSANASILPAGATLTNVRTPVYAITTSKSLLFLAKYYLAYQQSDLTTAQKDDLYTRIAEYAEMLLRFRKYKTGWGWELKPIAYAENPSPTPTPSPTPDLSDANLEGTMITSGTETIPDKAYYGAVASGAPGDTEADADDPLLVAPLTNAYACEALLTAADVADLRGDTTKRHDWRMSAKLMGDFLLRMSDGGKYYNQRFGAVIEVPLAGSTYTPKPGIVFGGVNGDNEGLYAAGPLWGMRAIVALKKLSSIPGTSWPQYAARAVEIRNRMTSGLLGMNNSYYPRVYNSASGKVQVADYNNTDAERNRWRPRKTESTNGTPDDPSDDKVYYDIGDDSIEVAFSSLWIYQGLSLGNTSFTYVNDSGTSASFDVASNLANFRPPAADVWSNNLAGWLQNPQGYDPYISFTGLIRDLGDGGGFKQYMPYYDIVGFGYLGEVNAGTNLSSYQNAWSRVVRDRDTAGRLSDLSLVMCDTNLHPYWGQKVVMTTSNSQTTSTYTFGYIYTYTYTTSKAAQIAADIGASLIKLTPYAGDWPH